MRSAFDLNRVPIALGNLAEYMIPAGKFSEVGPLLNRSFSDLLPEERKARILAQASLGLSDYESAEGWIQMLRNHTGDEAKASARDLHLRSLVLRGQWISAVAELESALASPRDQFWSGYGFEQTLLVSHLYLQFGWKEKAAQVLNLIDSKELDFREKALLGGAYALAGDIKSATTVAESIDLSEPTSRLHAYKDYVIGTNRLQASAFNEAVDHLQRAAKYWDDLNVRNVLAETLLVTDRWEELLDASTEIDSRRGEAIWSEYSLVSTIRATFLKARAYQGLGMHGEANKFYKEVVDGLSSEGEPLMLAESKQRLH
jgi:tetratricopeptide (TPR) repeat protein